VNRSTLEALRAGFWQCECEDESHIHPGNRTCEPARAEHLTEYGSFLVCKACHDAGHMPERHHVPAAPNHAPNSQQ